MTQKERNVIEAVRTYREQQAEHGPRGDDTIAARDAMFAAFTRLDVVRQTGYWREVGS